MPIVTFANINRKQDHNGVVYTACMNAIGKPTNLDVLTPSRDIVLGHKAFNGDQRYIGRYQPVSDKQYIVAYRKILESQNLSIRQFIDDINEDITICCYCTGPFCHRHLLAKWFKSYRPDLIIVDL